MMLSLVRVFKAICIPITLVIVSDILLTKASYSLFEYVCEEKILYKPYLHVYEGRKGRRIIEKNTGFTTLDHLSNIYVCINGPAYLFYSTTNELGTVYEAPQSGVFAHICEMHNIVPHKNASKLEYVLHLMAVLIYGDPDDYRRPGIQTFTAPYYFEEDEYGPGFPEHYQNATSVAIIGDGTCILHKEGPGSPHIPGVQISVMAVWPPGNATAPGNTTTPAPDDPEAERDVYVCKQGFSELQALAKAYTPPAQPALPALASPDDKEPEPTVDAALKFGDPLEKMKVFVNDWPITYTECESDFFHEPTENFRMGNLVSKMTKLAQRVSGGHDLATLKEKYGEKIFRGRKSFEAQIATLKDKLTKLKNGTAQIKQIEEKIEALELTVTKEREKYYSFAVTYKFAVAALASLKIVDDTGKYLDPKFTDPPPDIDGTAIDWKTLHDNAKKAYDDYVTAANNLTAIQAELLVDQRALKEAAATVKKSQEDPTTGTFFTSKEIHNNMAKLKLAISKGEVWYDLLTKEFDEYKKGPLVYPDKPDAKKKKPKRKLTYSRSTIPQHLYIVGEGATDPDAGTTPPGGRRKRRQANELDPSGLYNLSVFRREDFATDDFDDDDDFNGDPIPNSLNSQRDDEELDVDFGTEVERPKRLVAAEALNDMETNDVAESEPAQNVYEFDVGAKVQSKRQSPVSLLPKCEKLPKLRGEDGECRKGKPLPEVACGLLAHTTGHREAFPEGNDREDNWKKEILDTIGEVFIQACPNFYHRKHFVKRLINAFTYYLTSAEHFGQPPRPGVSQACRAFNAWEVNATHPLMPEIKPVNITAQDRSKFWSEILMLTTACRDAKKSLSFVSYEKGDDVVEWKFVTTRDRKEVDVNVYAEQAEKENIFNWVIDSMWKMFGTTHGICMGGYEVNNALISSRFYHMFSEDFLIPLQETWVNPRDNLIFQWIFSEFYYGDAEEWLERCMNSGYMFSERDSYRPMRPLLVNCKSEYNYLTNINAPYLNDLYYSDGAKIF